MASGNNDQNEKAKEEKMDMAELSKYWCIFHWFKGDLNGSEQQLLQQIGNLTSVSKDKEKLTKLSKSAESDHNKAAQSMKAAINKLAE